MMSPIAEIMYLYGSDAKTRHKKGQINEARSEAGRKAAADRKARAAIEHENRSQGSKEGWKTFKQHAVERIQKPRP